MILGVHVLYHTFFHIILCMALQYSCYSNISVTVTPHRSQKFYPLLCSKAQTNPQRSSLWHLWAFEEIKARSRLWKRCCQPCLIICPHICVCHDKHSPEHQWSHSKQGSPSLREDLLFQGIGEDDVQHSTGENKPSKNKSFRLATLILTPLIEYLAQTMQNRLNRCTLNDYV